MLLESKTSRAIYAAIYALNNFLFENLFADEIEAFSQREMLHNLYLLAARFLLQLSIFLLVSLSLPLPIKGG